MNNADVALYFFYSIIDYYNVLYLIFLAQGWDAKQLVYYGKIEQKPAGLHANLTELQRVAPGSKA